MSEKFFEQIDDQTKTACLKTVANALAVEALARLNNKGIHEVSQILVDAAYQQIQDMSPEEECSLLADVRLKCRLDGNGTIEGWQIRLQKILGEEP